MLNFIKLDRYTDRRIVVNTILSAMLDNIWLTLYTNRRYHQGKSAKHIYNTIRQNKAKIAQILAWLKINEAEAITFEQLNLIEQQLVSNASELNVVNISGIRVDQIYSANPVSYINTARQINYANLVIALSGANYYNELSGITLPMFNITSNGYTVTLLTTTLPVNIPKTVCNKYRSIDDLISRVTDNGKLPVDRLREFYRIINIDMLPDITTGMALTLISPEKKYSSSKADRYFQRISRMYDIMNPSLEADFTDTVDAGKVEPATEDKPEPKEEIDKPSEEPTDTKEPVEPTPEEDTTAKSDEPTEEPTADTTDNPDNPQPDQPVQPVGTNNTEDAKGMLGLNLELPKNENLDDFLFKLTVASKIDEIIAFNHDELETEVVTLLQRWKSLYLFLVSVKETKKLLSKLKVKIL